MKMNLKKQYETMTNEEINAVMKELQVLTMDTERITNNAEEFLHSLIEDMSFFLLEERCGGDVEKLAEIVY